MNRRTFLGAVGTGMLAGLAGCTTLVLGDPVDDLEVTVTNDWRPNSQVIYVDGEVYNPTQKDYDFVDVKVQFFDYNDEQVGSESQRIEDLRSRYIEEFNVQFVDNAVQYIEYYDIELTGSTTLF